MSVFDIVKNYEIIVQNYDILSAFMKFIFTQNLVFMKLSSFMKSSLYIYIYIYILSYCYYNKLGLSHFI